jgi:hypothetical protein
MRLRPRVGSPREVRGDDAHQPDPLEGVERGGGLLDRGKHAKLLKELEAAGELINGAGLHLPEETTTIRIAAGRPVSSTGPVAAGDEHVTAYYLLECPDRDRAVEIASRILDSHVTAVEVRQVHNSTGLA